MDPFQGLLLHSLTASASILSAALSLLSEKLSEAEEGQDLGSVLCLLRALVASPIRRKARYSFPRMPTLRVFNCAFTFRLQLKELTLSVEQILARGLLSDEDDSIQAFCKAALCDLKTALDVSQN